MEPKKTRKYASLVVAFAMLVSVLSAGSARAGLSPSPIGAAPRTDGQTQLFPVVAALVFVEAAVGAVAASYVFGLWTGKKKQEAKGLVSMTVPRDAVALLD
jgi:hypothetical protein